MSKYSQFLEFSEKFPTERACEEHLEQQRWGGNITCPHCNHNKCYKKIVKRSITSRKTGEKETTERLIYRCGKCKKDFSGRTGMIFEESRVALRVWYFCIHEAVSRSGGISSVEVAERMGITQKTAWFLMHRVREAMKTQEFRAPLSEKVEMDETGIKTGSPRIRTKGYQRTRGYGSEAQTPIACIVERNGEIRCELIANRTAASLMALLRKNVVKGSLVMTDDFSSYSQVKENGYIHKFVNHSKGQYALKDGTHTNTVEGLFGNFKRKLAGVHNRVSSKHLQRYCDHYVWLYNRKELSTLERLDSWLSGCVGRLTYDSLIV
jgi:transposase-like protein